MATFYFLISDGKQAEVALDSPDAESAMRDGMSALAHFAFQSFPPPENISIRISDADRAHVATLQLSFTIDYGRAVH